MIYLQLKTQAALICINDFKLQFWVESTYKGELSI